MVKLNENFANRHYLKKKTENRGRIGNKLLTIPFKRGGGDDSRRISSRINTTADETIREMPIVSRMRLHFSRTLSRSVSCAPGKEKENPNITHNCIKKIKNKKTTSVL